VLTTERLLLRRWRPEDRPACARMNADPAVTEHLVGPLTRAQSDAFVDRLEAGFAEHGVGMWAVEEVATGRFVGCAGLLHHTFESPLTPFFEIGYRFDRSAWGLGYATEAAREAVRYGFEDVGLAEIVSMTTPANLRSQAVMDRLGMTHDPADDFDHPRVPVGDPHRRHVLYRLTAEQWRAGRA
jgi:RimJ/RimL family protein N-acetyltransferase